MLLAFIIVLILGGSAMPAVSQPVLSKPARIILQSALNEARLTQRNVLLIFHASWCKWCKRLESVLDQSAIRKIIDENYIVVTLDVMERDSSKFSLENPGGMDLMKRFKGEEAGLPFYVFLDPTGAMIANSMALPGNQNIGYPGADDEIAAFGELLKKSAPKMNEPQRTVITDYLKKNAPR
jgi:thioredoxin-related protein